ncbi:glycosyl transferase, partial [Gorgonomyces haynaldii]
MKVFVTVGTTSFSDLVNYMLLESTQSTLKRLGYTQLTIQAGKSDINNHLELLGVSIFDYTMDLDRYILESDLVISHAGAGTIFQVLYHRKRLVAVVNESLMDNHQQELVQEMQ